MPTQIGIGALIYDDHNRILLIKSPSKWKGYGVPGGKPVPGESEIETIKREVKEETGIEIFNLVKAKEIKIAPSTDYVDSSISFYFKAYFARALKTNIIPNAEIEEYAWFSIEEALKLHLLGPIRQLIKTSQKHYLKE